jgi:predicted house-cleaning noncanonical NTP pyrophosphatase (MazG superfamily)
LQSKNTSSVAKAMEDIAGRADIINPSKSKLNKLQQQKSCTYFLSAALFIYITKIN